MDRRGQVLLISYKKQLELGAGEEVGRQAGQRLNIYFLLAKDTTELGRLSSPRRRGNDYISLSLVGLREPYKVETARTNQPSVSPPFIYREIEDMRHRSHAYAVNSIIRNVIVE
jgi:hypothetical protein